MFGAVAFAEVPFATLLLPDVILAATVEQVTAADAPSSTAVLFSSLSDSASVSDTLLGAYSFFVDVADTTGVDSAVSSQVDFVATAQDTASAGSQATTQVDFVSAINEQSSAAADTTPSTNYNVIFANALLVSDTNGGRLLWEKIPTSQVPAWQLKNTV